jgi:SAM-dependent methyltransferase
MANRFPSISREGYDRHILYEASVQAVDVDIELIHRLFRAKRKPKPLLLREDFCGTALMACEWIRSGPDRQAWGVDLDAPTLDWARAHRLPLLGNDAERLHLLQENVLTADTPPVDVVAALNFSYKIFRERELLKCYFRRVHDALTPGGLFLLDVFGGPQSQQVMTETKRIRRGKDPAGRTYPAFTYTWDQAAFNAIDQEIICHIHFSGGKLGKLRKAFTYHWRLWTLPELTDILTECGFTGIEAHLEGWDDDAGESDGKLRRRSRYEGMDSWIAYIAAFRD